jgi:hypothetical protein
MNLYEFIGKGARADIIISLPINSENYNGCLQFFGKNPANKGSDFQLSTL